MTVLSNRRLLSEFGSMLIPKSPLLRIVLLRIRTLSLLWRKMPLRLPSTHFGLGHGSGAHAPDEYFLIESSSPKVAGWDGAVMSYVSYLHELARTS